MLRAARRTRRPHRLHREAAHDKSLAQLSHLAFVARCAPGRIGQRLPQRLLHETPRKRMDRLRADRVGKHPVRPRRNLRDEVGVAARRHLARGGRGDGAVDDAPERRPAGKRLLHAVLRDGRAVGRVAVHRRRRADDHVPLAQFVRSPLRQVVQRPRSDSHRHNSPFPIPRSPFPIPRSPFPSYRLAYLLDLRVCGVEVRPVWIHHVFRDLDTGSLEAGSHVVASNGLRARVFDQDRLRVRRKQLAEHRRRAVRRAGADHARLRVRRVRKSVCHHRRFPPLFDASRLPSSGRSSKSTSGSSVAKLSKPSFQILRRASLFAPSVHVNACTVMPFA